MSKQTQDHPISDPAEKKEAVELSDAGLSVVSGGIGLRKAAGDTHSGAQFLQFKFDTVPTKKTAG